MEEIKKIEIQGQQYNIADVLIRDTFGSNVQIIAWTPTSNMNDFINSGIYKIEGERTGNDNLPIINQGAISARLEVFETESNNNKVVTQILNLNNNTGGEGNIYTRSCQNGNWKPWAKLQTNVEVGLIDQSQMDNLIDNGIYSGILSTTGETFVIICINNYAIAQQVGVQHISHLKYSLVVGTGEVKIEKRTRDAYGFWTEWENIGGGSTLPKATVDTLGGVKLGTEMSGYVPIRNIENNSMFGLGIKLGTATDTFEVAPLVLGTSSFYNYNWTTTVNERFLGIPIDTSYFNLTKNGLTLKSDVSGDSATKVTWDANSNMNDFKTAGVYEIYGERTRQDDNLPILNASSGHSIAARLTVVASTLQPANNEICVTQFLMLSNRKGGDGNMYVRTYNENNSPAADWWTPWQKLQGIREGYIFTDTVQVNPDGGVQQIDGVTGLNNMVDNGIYSGIYTDDPTFASPTFIDTFTLIVINNYAVAGKDERLKRTISQLKYAVDAITNQATVKKRTKTDGDTAWSDWEDIGGGSSEVDITDAVKTYGLPTLVAQGMVKEGVTYVIKCTKNDLDNIILDKIDGRLINHLKTKSVGTDVFLYIKKISNTIVIDAYVEPYLYYFRYLLDESMLNVSVSADMKVL